MADFQPPQLDWLHQVIGMRLGRTTAGMATRLAAPTTSLRRVGVRLPVFMAFLPVVFQVIVAR